MSENDTNKYQTRRVITGHDKEGKAVVWMDGAASNVKRPNDNIISTLLWTTDEMPADFMNEEDYGERAVATAPHPNGTRFIIFEMKPHSGRSKMHKTDTIDYVVCIEGEMTAILDDTEVILKPGDVLIQRGTNHGWENRSDQHTKLAIVLIDGKPKRDDALSGTNSPKY